MDSQQGSHPENDVAQTNVVCLTLCQAKILRMTFDPDGAIAILQHGLRPDRPEEARFQQADALVGLLWPDSERTWIDSLRVGL